MNWTQRMHLGSPYIKGEEEYSKCEMYKVIILMMEVMMMRGWWSLVEMKLDGFWLGEMELVLGKDDVLIQ